MRGKSVAAPLKPTEYTLEQQAELRKHAPGVSNFTHKINRMSGDMDALDKDAASYKLADV